MLNSRIVSISNRNLFYYSRTRFSQGRAYQEHLFQVTVNKQARGTVTYLDQLFDEGFTEPSPGGEKVNVFSDFRPAV
jgi:hypothetical protein